MTRQNYAAYLPRQNRQKTKIPAVNVKSEQLIKAAEQLRSLIKL
jgi:hypothetical protein